MKIQLVEGDITRMVVDAIVNAANSRLAGGGGVDGAIHRAGGPSIMKECYEIRSKQGGCPTGEAVITSAGNLPADYVIHTVGPVWSGGSKGEAALLRNAYFNSLKIADENHVKSIAFPNISTGIYGYPIYEAADIAIQTVIEYLRSGTDIGQVVFVCFDPESFRIYHEKLTKLGMI